MEKNFIDYIRIFCRSGHGGAGSKHFARTKFNPKAGPDGGDGGRGGHIILKGILSCGPYCICGITRMYWQKMVIRATKTI